jgi:hypothetical protein
LQDWTAALPREKNQLYNIVVRRWELPYAMMSVALDDALSMRARGELVCARQQVSITSELLGRFAASLVSAYNIFEEKAHSVSQLPAVEPLRQEFFRGVTGRKAACWSELVHLVLFGNRARFIQKIKILSDTLSDLDREFKKTSEDLSQGHSDQSGAFWTTLECVHYDMTTCLRESEVLLKSFLRVLSADQTMALAGEFASPRPSKGLGLRPSLSGASA